MKDEQLLRYSRHILLPEIDVTGQQALLDAHVVIIGMGGLGCPIALYLAASGVGQLTISDDDEVEISNLQRQIAHHTKDVGLKKVESAKNKINGMNPDCKVTSIDHRLSEEALSELANSATLIVDATDNFSTRKMINRVAIKQKVPVVFGAAVRLEGQILVYDPAIKDAPCYECFYQDVDDSALNCATSGVAAPVVGIIGTCQAMEAIRLLCSITPSSAGFLQTFDARDMSWNKFKLPKRSDCEACRKT